MTDSPRPAEGGSSSTAPAEAQPAQPSLPARDAVSASALPATASSPTAPPAVPLASVIARPKSSSGRGTSVLLGLAAAIAIGGVAFAAGRLTAPAAAATSGRNGQLEGGQLPGNGQGPVGRGAGFGGVTLRGTVSAVSADSLTVQLESGTEVTIPLDASTAYHAAAPASASAVTVGSSVSVTPGLRVANPDASRAPDGSAPPGFGGGSFGPATDVTVIAP